MRRLAAVFVVLVSLVSLPSPTSVIAQDACGAFDAWEWAQSVYDSDPSAHANLDPDGNGFACESLPRGGFAPALWTDTIPSGALKVTTAEVIDGNNLDLVTGRIRLARIDAPDLGTDEQCGGLEAKEFVDSVLRFNDQGQWVYMEHEGYIWFKIDGKPYLLNEVLVRSGYADISTDGDGNYSDQIRDAREFAKDHNLGIWGLCGAFNLPISASTGSSAPSQRTAPEPTAEPTYDLTKNQGPEVEAPVYSQPANEGCDPNYSPCVPNVGYDLDCADIGFSVQVIGYDKHGFDRDGDGFGCESY